jgi:hypothetical protein
MLENPHNASENNSYANMDVELTGVKISSEAYTYMKRKTITWYFEKQAVKMEV